MSKTFTHPMYLVQSGDHRTPTTVRRAVALDSCSWCSCHTLAHNEKTLCTRFVTHRAQWDDITVVL